MVLQSTLRSEYGLENHGIVHANRIFWNLTTSALYEEIVSRHEGHIAHLGPLVVRTGQHTGRSPKDKFVVREPSSENHVWWGEVNRPMEMDKFEALKARMINYTNGKDLFVQDCFAGADTRYRL